MDRFRDCTVLMNFVLEIIGGESNIVLVDKHCFMRASRWLKNHAVRNSKPVLIGN